MMKGIRWGAHISEFPDMVFIGDVGGGKRVYRREGERLKLEDLDIGAVLYGFYKDRLEDVQLHFRTLANFQRLKEQWFRIYGPGRQPNRSREIYHWSSDKFSMVLAYDKLSGKGTIGSTYVTIYRQRQQMKRNLEEFQEKVEKFKMVRKEVFQSIRR